MEDVNCELDVLPPWVTLNDLAEDTIAIEEYVLWLVWTILKGILDEFLRSD